LEDRELIESVYRFYAYEWISGLKKRLSLAPPDAGTYLAHLKERLPAEARGKVTFAGFVPRPALVDFYYNADVFAFAPIWDEGFGIPPVEAMAAGAPVVATRSGAIPETVRDQQTGFLVNKNDPRALAERILTLLHDDNLREKMGRAARGRVLEHFVWDRVADQMHRSYSNLCGCSEPTAAASAAM
jgi:glycosyltransferase involved in cell wall biosynthesis